MDSQPDSLDIAKLKRFALGCDVCALFLCTELIGIAVASGILVKRANSQYNAFRKLMCLKRL